MAECQWMLVLGGKNCPSPADHAIVFGCLSFHIDASYYCREHYDYWVNVLGAMNSWKWKCACGMDIEEWLGGNVPVR